jgi:hypothetical protein
MKFWTRRTIYFHSKYSYYFFVENTPEKTERILKDITSNDATYIHFETDTKKLFR